jgi:16S rRNA (cytosine967-C5)-methyltransferase
MTPAARVAAAIDILDRIGDGAPAEQVLTRWGRNNRFAGSKDRAAIRDHVFDVLRMRRSAAWLGGAATGRGLMIGLLRVQGIDPETLFTGEGHAPTPLEAHERTAPQGEIPQADAWDLPDWLAARFTAGLGEDAAATARILQGRAPVTLRVNTAKTDVSGAVLMLEDAGIIVVPNMLCREALTVLSGGRALRQSPAYRDGYVEVQDAASQAVVAALPKAARVLDYCAGGGGKALAIAARGPADVFAHDIDPARMADIAARAARAGARIVQLDAAGVSQQAPYDLVLVDAPCSGSGSWRRAPEAKWRLTPQALDRHTALQDSILDAAAVLVGAQGTLAYATCSILVEENMDRVQAFVARHPQWHCIWSKTFPVSALGDGFFTAHLTRRA